jgi:hypothetical protein
VAPFSLSKEPSNRLAEDWRNEVRLLSGLPVVGKMEVVGGESCKFLLLFIIIYHSFDGVGQKVSVLSN